MRQPQTMLARGFHVTRRISSCALCHQPIESGNMAFRGTLRRENGHILTFNWHLNCYVPSVVDYLTNNPPAKPSPAGGRPKVATDPEVRKFRHALQSRIQRRKDKKINMSYQFALATHPDQRESIAKRMLTIDAEITDLQKELEDATAVGAVS